MNGEQPHRHQPRVHAPGAGDDLIRVFWVSAPTMQTLVERLALLLSEHMHAGDELHLAYSATPAAGAQTSGPRRLLARLRGEEPEPDDAYTALIIVLARAPAAGGR